jgi:hypothetical protein
MRSGIRAAKLLVASRHFIAQYHSGRVLIKKEIS